MSSIDQPAARIAAESGLVGRSAPGYRRRLAESPATVVVGIALLWLLGAWLVPVTQDEAYYLQWARMPDWGYFDHPPLVALIGMTVHLLPDSVFVARLGTVACGVLSALATVRLGRGLGLTPRGARVMTVLTLFNLMGLVVGFITTPDVPLICCWTMALAEAALALRGRERRWLAAGLWTGLGLNAKYTMALIGPVFLAALIAQTLARRRAHAGGGTAGGARGLLSPWPYAGGLAALLVLTPNLWWNSRNDWITFRFQLRHGFSLERPKTTLAHLPAPRAADANDREMRLTATFKNISRAAEAEEYKPKPWDDLLKALNRQAGWAGSQVGLWGALLVPAGAVAWRARRRRLGGTGTRASDPIAVTATGQVASEVRPLAIAAAAVPLAFFGVLSLFTKVEANWSATYITGLTPFLVPMAAQRWRLVKGAAAVNVALLLAAMGHAATGFAPLRPHRDRLLLETHGYDAVARLIGSLAEPVFAETYQITAMLRFYAPQVPVRQWPGITRESEYVRNPRLADLDPRELAAIGRFWLITTKAPPPVLEGYSALDMTQLRDCKDGGLQVINAAAAPALVEDRCKLPIHVWYLVLYETAGGFLD